MKENTSVSPWTTRFHRAMTMALLALTTLGVKATDYVFVYNGNYLGINASGQITNYTTFNPTYCVWTCYNGTDEATLGTNNTNLRSLKNGNYYLNGSTTNGTAVSQNTDPVSNWRTDGNGYLRYRSGSNYYVYYRGNSWRTSSQNSQNSNNAYSSNSTDYRATAIASTNSNAQDKTTLPTVSCGLNGTTGILMSHTDLGGSYTPASTTLTVGTTTYYKGSDGKYSTTAPSATLSHTYAWSINSGSASITSGGVLTLSNNSTQNVTVRLTATNSNPSLTKTVDYKFTATQTEELNETDYSDIAVTPASQTLDLGGTATYAIPQSISQVTRTRPLYVTITDAASHTFYKVGTIYQNNEPAVTETPGADINLASVNWSAQTEGGAYFSLSPYYSATSNQVTLTRTEQKTASNQTFTITASAKYGSIDKEGTATVTIPLTYTDLTALHAGEAVNVGIGESESIEGHYTWEPDYDAAGAAYKKFTYTSSNTSIATVDADGKVTGVAPGSTTITIQSEKMDGTDGVSCTVTVNVSVPAPTISIAADGKVTITSPVEGMQIRYTTDGSNPTATTGTVYSGIFTASNEAVVKAIAVFNTTVSTVASKQYITSGISGNKVILNDYEDHNWSYYSDSESPIKSLYPRNVKITYYGYGTNTMTTDNNNPGTSNMTDVASNAVAVSMYESENTFVYYKTLERYVPINNLVEGTPQNIYPYDLIPNPFSKRPTYGTNADTKWRGFYGWRVKSVSGGKIYSNVNQTGEITTGTILTTEYQKLYFLPNDAGETNANNATSMTVEFEAIWARAYRVVSNANAVNTNISSETFQNVSYERNFLVINAGTTGNTNISNTSQKPVTVMMVEPDGSSDYRAATRYINPAYVIPQSNLKFEWMNM